MSKQFSFFMNESDVLDMEGRLRATTSFLVLHSHSPEGAPRVLATAKCEVNGKDWLYYFLVRPIDIDLVKMRHVPEQGCWVVNYLESPVIEFNKCFSDGWVMRRGRMYCKSSYYAADGSLVSKGEGFELWVRKVFAAAKKGLVRAEGDYVGKGAQMWKELAKGKFEV